MKNPLKVKKADIWISTVLYTALGVIALTLVLSATLPLINEMRDRNTVTQTRDLLYSLDRNIRMIISEGPGSQRDLSPLEISRGQFFIDVNNENKIKWRLETKAKISEPGFTLQEGTITKLLEETKVKGVYVINLELNYDQIADLILDSPYGNPFKGKYNLIIKNTGEYTGEIPKIAIKIT